MLEEITNNMKPNVLVKEEILIPPITIKEEENGMVALAQNGEPIVNHLAKMIITDISGQALEPGEDFDAKLVDGPKPKPEEIIDEKLSKGLILEPGEVPTQEFKHKLVLEPEEAPTDELAIKNENGEPVSKKRRLEKILQKTKDCYVSLHRGWNKNEIARCKKCRGKEPVQKLLGSTTESNGKKNIKQRVRHKKYIQQRVSWKKKGHHQSRDSGEKVFECKICCKKFPRQYRLKYHHEVAHTGNKLFHCRDCSYGGKTKAGLIAHVKRMHKDSKSVKCPKCPLVFRFNCDLQNHLRFCEKTRTCRECNYIAATKENLSLHGENVHGKKRQFECELCKYRAHRLTGLKEHILRHLKMIHRCKRCKHEFDTKSDLKKHVDNCKETKKYVCSRCGSEFDKRTDLHLHLKQHIGEKHFRCEICCKAFAKYCEMKQHKKSHTEERLFSCMECNYRSKTKMALDSHVKRIHVNRKPHKCSKCKNKSFRFKCELRGHLKTCGFSKCRLCDYTTDKTRNLQSHVKLVHPSKKKYECEICKKRFARKESMRNHILIHLNMLNKCSHCKSNFYTKTQLKKHTYKCEKRLLCKCYECDINYSSTINLKRHVRTVHTGEKPFKCETCGKAFCYQSKRKRHELTHQK